MTRRRKTILIALGFLVLGIPLMGYFSQPGLHHRVSVAEIETDLRANVNAGESRSEVEVYLDRKGLEHSYIENFDADPKLNRTEQALIRNSSWSLITRGDIQLLFRFDENGKLSDYSVKEIFTGF